MRRLSWGKQRVEGSGPIQRFEIIAATDVALADVDLRNGVSARSSRHFGPAARFEIHPDLVDLHSLRFQDLLGADAVRARRRDIHCYLRHSASLVTLPFVIEHAACRYAGHAPG